MINTMDWEMMTEQEKDAFVFLALDITKEQMDQLIMEFKMDTGKTPNAIFISADSLIKLPARIKHFKRPGAKLTVIPMESEPGKFVVSLQDPWMWGNLFYR